MKLASKVKFTDKKMEQKSPIKEESLGEVIDIVKDLIGRVDDKINKLY